jgi:DNA-binding XRE family transcriptional regulator
MEKIKKNISAENNSPQKKEILSHLSKNTPTQTSNSHRDDYFKVNQLFENVFKKMREKYQNSSQLSREQQEEKCKDLDKWRNNLDYITKLLEIWYKILRERREVLRERREVLRERRKGFDKELKIFNTRAYPLIEKVRHGDLYWDGYFPNGADITIAIATIDVLQKITKQESKIEKQESKKKELELKIKELISMRSTLYSERLRIQRLPPKYKIKRNNLNQQRKLLESEWKLLESEGNTLLSKIKELVSEEKELVSEEEELSSEGKKLSSEEMFFQEINKKFNPNHQTVVIKDFKKGIELPSKSIQTSKPEQLQKSSEADNLRKTLSLNMKKYRKQLKVSQEKLAELADLSPQTINDIEGCRMWVSDKTIAKLTSVFHIEAYQLFLPENMTEATVPIAQDEMMRSLEEKITKNLQQKLGEALKSMH